jgi:hypothetical protein
MAHTTPNPGDSTNDGTASPRPARRSPPVSSDVETADFKAQEAPEQASSPQLDVAAELRAAFGDRYELGECLGHGGFGAVFRAFDHRLGRPVAIKVARAYAEPERLLREARSLAQFRHDGIVFVFDVDVSPARCLVVSELLPGPSLSDWLEGLDGRRTAPTKAVQIVAAVADALAHAHSKSIIHRDVKPSNIVFAENERPVLVDFGLALSDLDVAAEHGLVSGTPSFMAPEQALGRAHRPDGRTDIYGLAATLYAMLCGRPPFRGRTSADVMRQVREDEPQPLRQIRPDVPPELERACLKGMAKNPADRYTTAADFADALRRAVGLLPGPVLPSTITERAVPTSPVPPVVPAPAAAPAHPSTRVPRAERRQVTLLQCAFEPGAADDDPTEHVAAFQAACAEAVTAHGGLVLPASGTAFSACFGYPVAREDAPRQAVRAALAVAGRAPLAVVVVGTGLAVVTEQPSAPPVVVGDAATLTAALLAQAPRGQVVIAESTVRLVDWFFDCAPAGEVVPRGMRPVRYSEVKAERGARNRVEAVDAARLTPLVGRDREVALLTERWELTAEGVQNVILLVADPGLGKSRLVRVLRDSVAPPSGGSPTDSSSGVVANAAVVEWYCSPYHQDSPFYPIIDYFDRAYRLSREPDPAQRLDRLITRLREDGVPDPEDQALLAALLSVPTGDRLPLPALSPERLRERTQEAVLGWLSARAGYVPVLFVVEDLHWIDPSTEALLGSFVDRGGEPRVLAVFTFRPEYEPPWKGKAVQTQVALNRLTRAQVAELVRAQAGAREVPAAVIERIAERTDGVPLFVEEFARLLAERGPGDGIETAVPATLNDLLLARLDRMASNKEVVQLGAVLGRTFSYAVVRAASDLDEPALRAELDKLVDAGLLFVKGAPPRCTYTFKHALIQDAAYQSMVKKQRQQFHRRAAEKLEGQFPEVAQTQPELLAQHFTEAGAVACAVGYWLKAGQRARERSANREAIRDFNRGLELLATLPESADRDRLELQFRVPLSTATTIACGWGDPGLEALHTRARVLCDRIGRDAPTFAVTWGQWAWRVLRAELDTANALVADLENQAAALDDGYRMEACFALACTALFRGEFDRNLARCPGGLALHDPDRCAVHARYTGQNAFCTISAFLGWPLALCGYPERAVRVFEEAIRVSQGTRDKYSEEYARYHLGCVQQHLRLGAAARASGATVVAIGTEQGFATWVALGTLCQGAGMVVEGRDAAGGLALIDAGVRGFKAAGAELGLSNYLAIAAEGHRTVSRPDRAWAVLDEAFAMVERTAERFQLSNLHRIRGDLLLDRQTPEGAAGAEAEYLRAIEVARTQQARSWELRAAIRLARLRTAHGRRADARAGLAPLYEWFTEGFQTPDLVEAKTLLDELS